MTGYDLTRAWYDFRFNNPGKTRALHSDLYFYIVDLWNRLGQKEKIGLPTAATMEALEIGSYNTYKLALNELIGFGFIKLIENSKNQHHSKIIALSKIDRTSGGYLDTAISISDKAGDKAGDEATDKATDTIDKQLNKETIKYSFDDFWKLYGKIK